MYPIISVETAPSWWDEDSIIITKTFDIPGNNKRFQPTFMQTLKDKPFRDVYKALIEYDHCPVRSMKITYSRNSWVKAIEIYGAHSRMTIYFDKHTRRTWWVR